MALYGVPDDPDPSQWDYDGALQFTLRCLVQDPVFDDMHEERLVSAGNATSGRLEALPTGVVCHAKDSDCDGEPGPTIPT